MAATLDDLHVETAINISTNAGLLQPSSSPRAVSPTTVNSSVPGVYRSLIYAAHQADRPNLRHDVPSSH